MDVDGPAGEVVAAAADSFDVDSFNFNFDDFDFDLAADEFCDAYAAFVADKTVGTAIPGGWLAGSGIDAVDGNSRETTDGPFAGVGTTGSLSDYVSELERVLMANDDDLESVAVTGGGEGAVGAELISVDDYLYDDLLAAMNDDADAGGGAAAAAEEETSLA